MERAKKYRKEHGEASRAAVRRYRERNRERINAYALAKYHSMTPEQKREYMAGVKKWNSENAEKLREYGRRYREKKREELRERQRQYRKRKAIEKWSKEQ